jgi:SAM-dependent methyltransferase
MSSERSRWGAGIVPSYDAIAEEYAQQYFDELDGKPFDRDILDRFAASVAGSGRVCDLGCGPGQIARYLTARGVEAFGIDASAAMVATARRLNPELEFLVGNFLALDFPDGALAGIAAFYSLIHVPRADLGLTVSELARVLQTGGRLLISLHAGTGEVTREEAYGKSVALVATLFSEDEVRTALHDAGMRIDTLITRRPYSFEYQSQRIYALGTRRSLRNLTS